MSSEAKIGIGVLAAVVLFGVLWLVVPHETPQTEDARRSAHQPGAAKKRSGQGQGSTDRVRERLAQLRAERNAAGQGAAPRPGQQGFPGNLPAPAFNAPAEQPLPPGVAETGDADLDFESLRDMALIDEDPDNRVAAIWLLATMDDEAPVLPVLTQALSDEDPEVRMAAIQALSEFSEEAPIESLNMALSDNDAEIRFEALSIVAEMTDERAQPLIQKALDDPDEDVRSLAEGLADMEDSYEKAPTP